MRGRSRRYRVLPAALGGGEQGCGNDQDLHRRGVLVRCFAPDCRELNGWSSPQMLARSGASARSARARRTYDRIMTDKP
jgi:hypothetical protein